MDDPRSWLALLNTAAFLLCVAFLAYVGLITHRFVRRGDHLPAARADHAFHLVVPCLDEEGVVVGTVDHLVTTFPDAVVWCVDDASSDATGTLLAQLAATRPQVRLVSRRLPEARQGKGAALNAAWRAIDAALGPEVDRTRVVVGVVDADARLDRSCLATVCGPTLFGDPTVSAVQVLVRVVEDVDALTSTCPLQLATSRAPGGDPLLVQLQDLEFSGPIAAMQTLRRATGSVGMGGNGQFTRLSALDRIAAEHGSPWHGSLLEDFELGLHVLLTGGRTEYCGETFVAQTGLRTVKPLLRQRSRWAQGGMQCARYWWQVVTSPNVPLTAALEITYYLSVPWTQLVGAVVFPAAIAVDVHYALSTAGGASGWWVSGAWGLLPLAVVFGIVPHVMWGPLYRETTGGHVTRRRAALLSVANAAYAYLLQVAVWWAFWRTVRGRTDWKKTARRVAPAAAPAGAIPRPRTPEHAETTAGGQR
ncbi:glycosyltransferase [Streptomyces sp. NP160]|uniref:glycosyltransferase family 2 protein n=1 Tax=Streptomyces sp. NP160 TaxID=2586637 RepID=UPI00111BB4C5|nr:glycosyltransferase [Streptomyces sp. NP160]TNM69178.1 glycosyltransferase [Streptomyces sp. NP160]